MRPDLKGYAINQTIFLMYECFLDSRILFDKADHAFNRYTLNWSHLYKVSIKFEWGILQTYSFTNTR